MMRTVLLVLSLLKKPREGVGNGEYGWLRKYIGASMFYPTSQGLPLAEGSNFRAGYNILSGKIRDFWQVLGVSRLSHQIRPSFLSLSLIRLYLHVHLPGSPMVIPPGRSCNRHTLTAKQARTTACLGITANPAMDVT